MKRFSTSFVLVVGGLAVFLAITAFQEVKDSSKTPSPPLDYSRSKVEDKLQLNQQNKVIRDAVQVKIDAYLKEKEIMCTLSIYEKASLLADSILMKDAANLLAKDTSKTFPDRPDKPAMPEKMEPKSELDNTPILDRDTL